jgi:histidine ammonia-lyase
LAFAHMGSAMIGDGEFFVGGARIPAKKAIAEAGLQIPPLGPKSAVTFGQTQMTHRHVLGSAIAVGYDHRSLRTILHSSPLA